MNEGTTNRKKCRNTIKMTICMMIRMNITGFFFWTDIFLFGVTQERTLVTLKVLLKSFLLRIAENITQRKSVNTSF